MGDAHVMFRQREGMSGAGGGKSRDEEQNQAYFSIKRKESKKNWNGEARRCVEVGITYAPVEKNLIVQSRD